MPKVSFDGSVYSLTSRKTIIPDFSLMSRTEAIMWLIKNPRGKGHSMPVNPLVGFAGAISIK